MKPTLFSRILTDNDNDAAKLDNWIVEREIDIALREHSDDSLPFMVDADRLANAASPHDAVVAPGQIRILSADFVSDGMATPYIAVLDHWGANMWLVAPFSPYSTPATDGEIATGIPLAAQHVLQCWNARTANEKRIGCSYVMGMLNDNIRKNALALFRHVSMGVDLPSDFSAVIGPPILSKADPRRKYLAESMARYAPLTEAAQNAEAAFARTERLAALKATLTANLAANRIRLEEFLQPISAFAPDYALAAGDKTVQTVETFIIPEFGVELDVKHTPSEGKVRFIVYKDGKLETQVLEGFAMADRNASPIGEIRAGVLVAEAASVADGFILVNPASSKPVAVEKSRREGK